jgi:hypothetical protein
MSIRNNYRGPTDLADDVKTALKILNEQLAVTAEETKSHTVLTVEGFGYGDTLEASAVYLVGAVAASIEQNMSIRHALYDEADVERDLHADIVSIIRSDNAIDDEFRIKVRDPWLWEGISHLFVHLSQLDTAFHPSGNVLVKTSIKHDVHDHGLDLVAIYRSTAVGLSAGESKAYLDDPGRGIRDASNRLREVDQNKRDTELRSTINQLLPSLSPADKSSVAGAFWRNERTYIPFVCCDESYAEDWKSKRPTLTRLDVAASKKLLVPLSIASARDTFDSICSLMREYPSHTA